MSDFSDRWPRPAEGSLWEVPPPEQKAAVRYPFSFEGTGREYFRIWIVNTFLTIVTAGIYAAWAKVRTRRYFYSNTVLAGHSFEFLGDPRTILKGNLIIGAGAILYYLVKNLLPVYSIFIVAAFYIFLPYLIYKSLRFNARNTSYRNIRFHFTGTLKESYKAYLFWPLLLVPTLGVIYPYWSYRKKKYFFDSLSYGTAQNSFKARPGPFYRAYALVLVALPFLLVILSLGGLMLSQHPTTRFFSLAPFVLVVVWGLLYIFFRQYLYVRLNNYCFTQSVMGPAALGSAMGVGRLTWIYLTNIIAIIFSVGLLIPWAKVRRTRYILESLAVITAEGLDDFAARAEGDVGGLGDAATDIFDIAIGL